MRIRSFRTHCNYPSGPNLHRKSCNSPYKFELLTQKPEINLKAPLTIEFDVLPGNPPQCSAGAQRVYLLPNEFT